MSTPTATPIRPVCSAQGTGPHHLNKRGEHGPARPVALGTAATAVLLAIPHGAEASIVYVDPTDIVVAPALGAAINYPLDLNGDSIFEFQLAVGNQIPTFPFYGIVHFGGFAGQLWLGFHPGYGGRVARLASGEHISATPTAPFGWFGGTAGPMRKYAAPFLFGQWVSGQTGFAGVRIDKFNGDVNYGWVRMRVDDVNPTNGTPDRATIFDWAYEDTPHAMIIAGAGAVAPEPGTTALLVLAGAGAAALRRRRSLPQAA